MSRLTELSMLFDSFGNIAQRNNSEEGRVIDTDVYTTTVSNAEYQSV